MSLCIMGLCRLTGARCLVTAAVLPRPRPPGRAGYNSKKYVAVWGRTCGNFSTGVFLSIPAGKSRKFLEFRFSRMGGRFRLIKNKGGCHAGVLLFILTVHHTGPGRFILFCKTAESEETGPLLPCPGQRVPICRTENTVCPRCGCRRTL